MRTRAAVRHVIYAARVTPSAPRASARLSGSRGGSVLGGPGFTRGQEPGARPQPQHLTVMPKDHTQ